MIDTKIMMTEVNSLIDVSNFFYQLIDEGLNYHPDDDFDNYIKIETGDPAYTVAEALLRNRINKQCFKVCESAGVDIYDISMEIFLYKSNLNNFIPLPSQTYLD